MSQLRLFSLVCVCSGASPDLSDLVPGLPASSSLANLRWRTGHLPDRAGCMKLNSTGIESSPEKMVSVSAYGPRTTSDYSTAFTRIRHAVAALPIDCVVLDGEAVLLRSDNTSDFDGVRSRHGQAEAILVAYDVMELDEQDVRQEPLEERRKRLRKLLSRS